METPSGMRAPFPQQTRSLSEKSRPAGGFQLRKRSGALPSLRHPNSLSVYIFILTSCILFDKSSGPVYNIKKS